MQEVIMAMATTQGTPTIEPSNGEDRASEAMARPAPIPEVTREEARAYGGGPAFAPPMEARKEGITEGVAAWHTNKKVTACWSDASNRNAWIALDGMGWKKLSNANDSAIVSMAMLGAHAEQTGVNVNARIEDDGMIHELYVW
jgi:hypothetical protein